VSRPLFGLLYDECGAIDGTRIGRGSHKYSEETCPGATLSTTNAT
jgi:hypothetical protein